MGLYSLGGNGEASIVSETWHEEHEDISASNDA